MAFFKNFNNDDYLILGLFLIAGAWFYSKRADGAGDDGYSDLNLFSSVSNNFDEAVNTLKNTFSVNRIADAKPAMLNNTNVQAFLKVIRTGEGTADALGYSRLFGGASFSGFADHPRKVVKKSGYTSTAAGAYQFLSSTWDETAKALGLRDFSPASQDLAALGRIAARGALDDVINGNFESAIKKVNKEWASMPLGPYGQPTMTMASAAKTFKKFGGKLA